MLIAQRASSGMKWEWSWLGVSCSWVGYRRLQAAGNQPKEETSPTNGMSLFFFFSICDWMNMNEQIEKRNKEMKLKRSLWVIELKEERRQLSNEINEINWMEQCRNLSLPEAKNAAPSWPTQRGKSLPSTLLSLRLSMESQQRKGWVVGLLSLFFQLGLPAAPHFLQSLRDCWLVSLPAQLRSHANQHSALLRGPTQKEELELLLAKNIITKRACEWSESSLLKKRVKWRQP